MRDHRTPYLFIVFTALALSACQPGPEPEEPGSAFLNLDFEHTTPRGQPMAWYVEADAATAAVAVDPGRSRSGAHALRISTEGGAPVALYTPLFLDDDADSCVRSVSATGSVFRVSEGADAALFFIRPGHGLSTGEPAGGGPGEWIPASATLEATEGCLPGGTMVGVLVTGAGEAWVDALSVRVDGEPLSGAAGPPADVTDAALVGLRDAVLELDGDGSAAPDGLGDVWAGARVVGLGENSHGARALFHLKQRLIRSLVTRYGFSELALEMPVAAAATVDAYVRGESDDRAAVISALSYPAWQSEEMLAVVEWLRAHNREAAEQVGFHGLDVAQAELAGRDPETAMADRVSAIAADAGGNADTGEERGVIVWADNTHVTEAAGAMGAHLAERFGEAYVTLGLTFAEGEYSAYGPEQRYPVHAPYPGTHEDILSRVGPDAFLLPLAVVPPGHPLLDVRGFRYIGSRPQTFTQFYPHRLREHFDIVGFVRRTEATTYLLEHEF